jgi:hypothetical protein
VGLTLKRAELILIHQSDDIQKYQGY